MKSTKKLLTAAALTTVLTAAPAAVNPVSNNITAEAAVVEIELDDFILTGTESLEEYGYNTYLALRDWTPVIGEGEYNGWWTFIDERDITADAYVLRSETYRGLQLDRSTYEDVVAAYGPGIQYPVIYDIEDDDVDALVWQLEGDGDNLDWFKTLDCVTYAAYTYGDNEAQIVFYFDEEDIFRCIYYVIDGDQAGLFKTIADDQDAVTEIQEQLNAAGYNCGTPDGLTDEDTKAAISKYQEDHGLAVTGLVSSALYSALVDVE